MTCFSHSALVSCLYFIWMYSFILVITYYYYLLLLLFVYFIIQSVIVLHMKCTDGFFNTVCCSFLYQRLSQSDFYLNCVSRWIFMVARLCVLMQMRLEKIASARLHICIWEYPRFHYSVHDRVSVCTVHNINICSRLWHCSVQQRCIHWCCPPAGPVPDWIMVWVRGHLLVRTALLDSWMLVSSCRFA